MRRVLSGLTVAALAAAVVFGYLYLRAPRANPVKAGMRAPALTLPSLKGGTAPVPLTDLGTKAVLLVFLDSSWAGARTYLQEVDLVHRRYFRRNFATAAVLLDHDAEGARTRAQAAGVTFTVLHDPRGEMIRATYGVPQAPEAYLVNRDGLVSAVYRAATDWRSKDVRAAMEAVVDPAGPGGW